MNYLQPSEYTTYGLEPATAAAWVTAASAIIDSHCRRETLGIFTYTERLRVDSGLRPLRLSYRPLAPLAPATSSIVSIRARYSDPRHGELPPPDNFCEELMCFILPGSWVNVNIASADFLPDIGEITLPYSVFGWPYSEAEITYTAGFDPIPGAVKVACAQIVKNAQATPAINVRRNVLPDRVQLHYFQDSLLDQTVTALLAPYVARKVG